MHLPLANYTAEKAEFQNLLQPNSDQRVLMFHGESGSGKSTLLRNCKSSIPAHIPHVTLDLKGRGMNAEYLFYKLGHRAGWERVTAVTQQIAAWQDTPHAYDQPAWQNGIQNHLRQIFTTVDAEQKSERQAILTERWFEDTQSFQTPFLLLIDTYEKATDEWDVWFSQHFLPWVGETESVRVLLAGTHVPEPSIEWSDCSHQMELRGVAEANAWLPVAEAMGRRVDSFDFLKGACAMANGDPAMILQFIEGMPRSNGTVQSTPTAAPTLDRRKLLPLLQNSFSGNELRTLCFFLDLDYDDELSGTNKQTKLIELIRFVERQNRTIEFLSLLREERPREDW